jgi:hypothetical protein
VLTDGLLAEGHWLDAKREIGSGKTSKKELARDIASFANDGGALVIGIAEDKQAGTFTLAPLQLDGVTEMIEQVVGHHCDPPVFVQCHRIVDPDDPAGPNRGVLIVEVAPSPLAPHVVDGKYYGRGDTVKCVLSDAEVERLHATRRARQVFAEDLIEHEIARDPFQGFQRAGVRLYVVARPLASPPELLTEHLSAGVIGPLIIAARAHGAGTTWQRMDKVEPRAKGLGWHSLNLRGRRGGGTTYGESDLEVYDDGTVAFFADNMSYTLNSNYPQQEFVRVETVLGLVRSVVQLAGSIGATFGYAGQWQLAVGVTNLAGLPAGVPGRETAFLDLDELVVYSEERYVAGTTASTVELAARPAGVTRRLLMRFARGFGMLDRFEDDDHLGRPREDLEE